MATLTEAELKSAFDGCTCGGGILFTPGVDGVNALLITCSFETTAELIIATAEKTKVDLEGDVDWDAMLRLAQNLGAFREEDAEVVCSSDEQLLEFSGAAHHRIHKLEV